MPDIMISVKSDGYIEDKNRVMYPLENVISIEWKLIEERIFVDSFDDYQIFVKTK